MAKKTLRIDRVKVVWEPDGYGDPRMQRCHAFAEVSYPINSAGDRRLETLTSGGLSGITVLGPDDPYKIEIETEQLDELRDHLEAFGIDTRSFASRFAPALQR